MDLKKEIQFLKPLLIHQRKVARKLGISREAVAKYWNEPIPTSVGPLASPEWTEKIDWEYVQAEIKNGVSIKTLYKELSHVESLPAYENVARYIRPYNKPEKEPDISLKIDRTPGRIIEIDYSGDKMQILNPATGEILTAELFVAALSFSSYFYAEFTFTQKLSVFLDSCKNTFEHLGSVTLFMISDNCKTAVSKAEKHDAYLSKAFRDFCHHYNVIADPARVRRPKDKPHVENAINVIQLEFFQKYRHTTFTSLLELNLALKKYLLEKMNEKMPCRGLSRNELLAMELPHMRDLPSTPFELFNYKS
jgi:transposase